MQYTDGAGSTRRRLVKPVKIYADEGIYNVVLWTDVAKAAPEIATGYCVEKCRYQQGERQASHLAGASYRTHRTGQDQPNHPGA